MTKEQQQSQLHLAFPGNEEAFENIINKYQHRLSQIKPGVRFFARYIDYMLFSFLFILLLSYFIPAFDFDEVIFGILSLFIWVFVETLLLITWGTTPGKWLLNIKIKTNDNKKPSLGLVFKRSIKVWFFGLGIGLPFITLFTLFCAYFELNKNKKTTWDQSEHFSITHNPTPLIKITLAVFIIGTPISLNLYELYTTRHHIHETIKYQGLSAL